MDSKQLGQLDPKLKEVYERVMGTSPTSAQKPSPFVAKPASPITAAQTTIPQPIIQPQPFQSQAKPVQSIQQAQLHAQPMRKPLQNIKKKNKMLPILITLGGMLFLSVYTFFWIKFFNLKLSFLPF